MGATMGELIRRVPWSRKADDLDALTSHEWIATNGLGGFASGTVCGVPTRRYHGLLVAALPAPLGRVVMLTHLSEELQLPDGRVARLSGEEQVDRASGLPGVEHLVEFRTELGLPVWRYQVDGTTLEKRLVLPHRQNTVFVVYRLLAGDDRVWLRLRPSTHFRALEAPVSERLPPAYRLTVVEDRYELSLDDPLPPLRMCIWGNRQTFTVERERLRDVYYRTEDRRGYASVGELWSPGHFGADLDRDQPTLSLVASTESWDTIAALDAPDALAAEQRRRRRLLHAAGPAARGGMGGELVLAADQFVFAPIGRTAHAARAQAAGDELRSVIAGYHWFTDWGRDTMISLEGLTLVTGRHVEAGYILRTFAHYVRDGLIPNMFPEGQHEGLYHTADATLWFFHALDRYLQYTDDQVTLRQILPRLREIVERHVEGTRFGIGVDSTDGLLDQGEQGYQLTWMDAKVDNWVVTPRRGKAVEINALWYNALKLLAAWERDEGETAAADRLEALSARAAESFNARFWFDEGGHLYDLVDGEAGDDPACRPNQLLAISLPHPVLDPSRWPSVVRAVEEQLLTPVGLRSLAPESSGYQPRYFGDLRARDAAYHQGTVWAWLIGPFVDAWLKLHPGDHAGGRRFLSGFEAHLAEAGVGSISEIFDAEPPFVPRGCIAQAWSVAEVLRCWVRTAPEPTADSV
jgi:predicted glycogen debranching enzyme